MVWTSLFLMLPMPALAVIQSYFQGVVLYSRRTRSITESVSIFLGRGGRRPRDRSALGRRHRTLRRRRGLDGRRVAAHALALVAQRPGT